MVKKLLLLVFAPSLIHAQTTLIPDARFERALIDLGIDTDQTINGQMATQDAWAVTSLEISTSSLPNYPYTTSSADYYDGLIHDLTGLEAFVNVEQLTVSFTMAEQINLSGLVHLKHLIFGDNMLTSVDVSHNPLLETVEIANGGDVYPMNYVSVLDLSHNPNINSINANGVTQINLNNQNNLQNMLLNVGCGYCWGYPIDYMIGTVCIQVDNPLAAVNHQFPYTTWTINHMNLALQFTDDVVLCALGNETFKQQPITIAPNPTQDVIHLQTEADITEIKLYDLTGRLALQLHNPGKTIALNELSSGVYMLEISTSKGTITQKLVKE